MKKVDGLATLQWIESRPWFNGVLGMWGPSYLGYVQWLSRLKRRST
jgi:predicted acyl esterase